MEADERVGDADAWDAAIVGAGPAGSICALQLALCGHRVLLVERHRFPRDKACGDLLIPGSLEALRRAGLYERVRRSGRALEAAAVSSPSRIEWPIRGEFVVIKRLDLDAMIARGAAEAGAVVARGTVEGIEADAEGPAGERGDVRLRLKGGAVARARIAVLATGADVRLLEGLGMIERKAPTAVALRAYLKAPVGPDRLLISFDRSIVPGYGWIFPLPGDEYNVGIGTLYEEEPGERPSLKALLDRFLASYPPARAMMEAGGSVSAVRGARLRCGLEGSRLTVTNGRGAGGRVLAIGEAIGTTYPFTGEGMGKAMESGELAAEAIHRALTEDRPDWLDEYPRRLREELAPRYRGYRVAQDWFSRPLLNDLLAWRARRSPFLQRKASQMVAEASDPREAFSLRGLLRSLWS